MPPSVHILLIHGWQIIECLVLPLGEFSEEAQEAIHKYFKQFREKFAMKTDR